MEKTNLTLEDVAACLDRIGLQYLATIGLDGKPKVRPVQYMIIRDRKLWFCTNSEKSMYAELQNNPYVDLCASRLEQDEIKPSARIKQKVAINAISSAPTIESRIPSTS